MTLFACCMGKMVQQMYSRISPAIYMIICLITRQELDWDHRSQIAKSFSITDDFICHRKD